MSASRSLAGCRTEVRPAKAGLSRDAPGRQPGQVIYLELCTGVGVIVIELAEELKDAVRSGCTTSRQW
jgi:methylase of polypeptide subunit release factors